MSELSVKDTIEEALSARTVDDVHRLCSAICERHGFDYFLYGAQFPTSLVNPEIVIVSGYPDQWWGHYVSQGYMRIDPLVAYCENHITPLDWERIDHYCEEPDAHAVMNEARDFGLRSGMSCPVHGSSGEAAVLSVACKEDHRKTSDVINESLAPVHLLASYVHEAVRRVFDQQELMLGSIQLTVREREALVWAAEGKAAWEIGKTLHCSERTVIYHLQNVAKKLGVSNRQQAIARAVSLGIIRPRIL